MAKPFILDPDSSAYRIGAVLQQYVWGKELSVEVVNSLHVVFRQTQIFKYSPTRIGTTHAEDSDGKQRLHQITYESEKLTPTEQHYLSQKCELLAAKYALNHWRHLLEGSEITIRTDHESLKV